MSPSTAPFERTTVAKTSVTSSGVINGISALLKDSIASLTRRGSLARSRGACSCEILAK